MKERLNSENRQRLKEEMAGSAKGGRGISARNTSLLMASIALIVSLLLIQTIYLVQSDYSQLRAETTQYLQWQRDASDLQEGSDYLTEQVRCFAETGEREYLDGYFEEAEVTRKRDNAVMRIHEYMGEAPAYHALVSAMSESVALMDREYYAMRLKIEACGYDLSQFPRVLQDVALSAGDDKLPAAEKDALARSMVFDQAYHEKKVAISGKVQECLTELANTFEARGIATADQLYGILSFQRVLIIVSVVITILMVLASILLIVRPLGRVIRHVQENKPLPIQGAQEIRFLADVYNQMYDTNREQRESITSLLDNMPVMSFYKDVKTGVYKACNQAFADYAH